MSASSSFRATSGSISLGGDAKSDDAFGELTSLSVREMSEAPRARPENYRDHRGDHARDDQDEHTTSRARYATAVAAAGSFEVRTAASLIFTLTSLETPGSCIVTP